LGKLIGNTEIEDALKELDRLTQEEAQMASAEHLKITHSVDVKVMGVDDKLVQVNRSSSLTFLFFIRNTQTYSQGTSSEIVSVNGFRLRILP